jgi:hypothetical protein
MMTINASNASWFNMDPRVSILNGELQHLEILQKLAPK